ncbi:MAG: hypothetical protein MK291_08390 [Planctomycetes bacterium]|nr:hypothetical protein [Planctomycetota bacterium]
MTDNTPPPEPSEDELLAMAYADGELNEEARREAAHRMASDEAFALRVAHYQRLDVTARSALQEPQDIAHAKLAAEPTQRAALGLGWAALSVGLVGFYAWIFYVMVRDPEMPTTLKVLMLTGIGGFLLLFLAVLRKRLRELPFDPYTKVQR